MAETPDVEEPKSPADWAKRWTVEFTAAKKELEKWHKQGDKIIKRFLDERDTDGASETRWNLFTANMQTVRAIMYGKTPKVDVTRRFADADDDVARVAGEMLERILNTDIENGSDGYASALAYALWDYLLCGMGNVRVRYSAEFATVPGTPAVTQPHPMTGEPVEVAPEVPETEAKSYECVETDYIHWKDQLWGPSRVWDEVPWWAHRAAMGQKEFAKRFPGKPWADMPKAKKGGKHDDDNGDRPTPMDRVDVWEVWSKDEKKAFWFVEGYHETLDVQDDPLELEGFWPCPRPLFANTTTSKLVPRPDFIIAQDLYDEVDTISTRITILERAIRVAGLYDKTADGVQRLLKEDEGNILIPVENWAMFAEKGGIAGQIDWLPLEMIVGALSTLREYRTEVINALYQITGLSDIVRGQSSGPTTATEQSIKAKFASVRLQSLQDEFARFATDAQRLKAEIIAKQFEPKTLLEQSNILRTPDKAMAMQAVQLIKSEHSQYRVEVKPEAVSLTDYAALRQERTEVIGAIGGYLQIAGPLAQSMPGSTPFLLKILQWLISGLKGSNEIEGVLDQAINQATQAAAQPPQQQGPDPKMQMEMMKSQMQQGHTQQQLQADLSRMQAETQAHGQRAMVDARIDVAADAAKSRNKVLADISSAVNPPGSTGAA